MFSNFTIISYFSKFWRSYGMCNWNVCGCCMWNYLLVDAKASGKVNGQCNSDGKSKISLWKDIPYSVSFTIHIQFLSFSSGLPDIYEQELWLKWSCVTIQLYSNIKLAYATICVWISNMIRNKVLNEFFTFLSLTGIGVK